MSLPADISRCNGVAWPDFGVQAGCMDCQRYLATKTDGDDRWYPYMQPPAKMPCVYRIEATKEKK